MAASGRLPFLRDCGRFITGKAPLFASGKKDPGKGLEAQAEDGNPEMLAKSLKGMKEVKSVGIFNTPAGATAAGPVGPGGAYEFTLTAGPGTKLSLAMIVWTIE